MSAGSSSCRVIILSNILTSGLQLMLDFDLHVVLCLIVFVGRVLAVRRRGERIAEGHLLARAHGVSIECVLTGGG